MQTCLLPACRSDPLRITSQTRAGHSSCCKCSRNKHEQELSGIGNIHGGFVPNQDDTHTLSLSSSPTQDHSALQKPPAAGLGTWGGARPRFRSERSPGAGAGQSAPNTPPRGETADRNVSQGALPSLSEAIWLRSAGANHN